MAQRWFYLLRQNTLTAASCLAVVSLVVIGLLAPWIAPHPEAAIGIGETAHKLQGPSSTYPFGTDELGRDIFSRVIFGARISLQVGITAVGLALLIGVPLGIIAGYSGGVLDEFIMRTTDIFLSFPPLLLAVAVATFLGRSLTNVMIAIAISWWPWYTRLVRSQAVSIRSRPFITAAVAMGTPVTKIMFGHMLPNCLAPVIVQASMDFGSVILTASALSFLGLGAQPPSAEWGLMLSTSRNYYLTAWWYMVFPGTAVFLTVLAFNLFGDGLRELMDPKSRSILT